jgi:hypothetical protein
VGELVVLLYAAGALSTVGIVLLLGDDCGLPRWCRVLWVAAWPVAVTVAGVCLAALCVDDWRRRGRLARGPR